jgi:CheY-like chemotaxis protein
MNGQENGSFDVYASSDNRAKRTALLVDNDALSLQHVSMLLQQFDLGARTATSAREAFTSAMNEPPAIIITALRLKDMHGLNFIKLLRKNPATAEIPFITLRNPDDELWEKYCFNAGATDCLMKPVSAELLYRAIQGGLEERPRASIRLRTILPVWVDTMPFDGGDDVHTLDISEHGLFLRTGKPAPEHTHISFRINLDGIIIKAEAKVIYACPPCRGPYNEPGNGLRFTLISPDDRDILKTHMKKELSQSIVPVHGSHRESNDTMAY